MAVTFSIGYWFGKIETRSEYVQFVSNVQNCINMYKKDGHKLYGMVVFMVKLGFRLHSLDLDFVR